MLFIQLSGWPSPDSGIHFFPTTHAILKHHFWGAWRCVCAFILTWQRKLKRCLVGLQMSSFMDRESCCRYVMVPSAGTVSVRELSVWSTLSHAGLLFLVSRLSKRSAIRHSEVALTFLPRERNRLFLCPGWALQASSLGSISCSLIVLPSGILFFLLSSSPPSILQALAIPADRICCAF